MPDGREQGLRAAPPGAPGEFTICEDCWGESDTMDDAFQCGTCRGHHWVCCSCGEIERDCGCQDDEW